MSTFLHTPHLLYTANHFEVTYEAPGGSSYVINITAQAVGTSVTTRPISLPTCNDIYTFTVVAVDASSVKGKASNPVRENASCTQPNQLSAGQITGIVIGCILALIIIFIIVFLCRNRDHLDDLWLWRMLTCRCCIKNEKDDDRLYNPPPRSANKRSDVIRNNTNTNTNTTVTPIRNISDLYSKPNVEGKRTQQLKNEERQQQQQQGEESDDGGFRDPQQQRRRNNIGVTSVSGQSVTYRIHNTNNADVESQKSSLGSHSTSATIPINQVGLPPPHSSSSYQRDNHGYDAFQDSYGDGYNRSNKPDYITNTKEYHPRLTRPKPTAPPPMPPRNNTQV